MKTKIIAEEFDKIVTKAENESIEYKSICAKEEEISKKFHDDPSNLNLAKQYWECEDERVKISNKIFNRLCNKYYVIRNKPSDTFIITKLIESIVELYEWCTDGERQFKLSKPHTEIIGITWSGDRIHGNDYHTFLVKANGKTFKLKYCTFGGYALNFLKDLQNIGITFNLENAKQAVSDFYNEFNEPFENN